MLIRIRATGQVEDFDPAFARRAIESEMAESLDKKEQKSGMPVFTVAETAAVAPPETAMVGRPSFYRTPRSR